MTTETITTISPSTNKPVLTRHGLSPEDMLALGTRGQSAFQSYRKSHPTLESRQAIVERALKTIEDRTDELASELTAQMGRPIAYTGKEISTALLRARYMLRISSDALAPTPGDAEKGFKRYIERLPIGVVLVIFAWNYPYLILVNSLIPCILAGNTVLLKPSPQTPTIAEHMKLIFEEAGLPKDIIQFVHCGRAEDLRPLILSKDINHVTFTGSVAGGLAVQKIAADRIDLTVGLELGGKDPSYVRSDADPAWAADEIIDGAVFNSGQSCCAIERVYVHASIYDQFVAEAQKVLAGYKLGDPHDKSTNVGPVISARAKETIQSHIKAAVSAGATDATPKNDSFASPPSEGNYVAPTLLTNVDHSMAVMRDETFGPVVPVMKVSSDEEAIELMNDSQFGLTATIWTKDVPKGEELAQQVQAGTVFVNRADYPSPDLAWTGWKESGKGVTMGRWGFEQYVKMRSVHVKDYPK
jgi:acyl-CoA reductase-like NAD-dependent aldehyde dehydrogenase